MPDPLPKNTPLPKKLRIALERSGMTQLTAAAKAKVSQPVIHKVLKEKPITLDSAVKVARAAGYRLELVELAKK